MGREIKRVAAGFEWPIGKTWPGFTQPDYPERRKCNHCDGLGYSKQYKALQEKWYGYAPFTPAERGSLPIPVDHPKIVAMVKRNAASGFCNVAADAERLAKYMNGQWCHHLNADDVYALVRAGRLHDFTHSWTRGKGWRKKNPPYYPTPQEVNEWSIGGMGHDGINGWVVIKAELRRLRLPNFCAECKGKGEFWSSQQAKRCCAAWKPKQPPIGDWWQVWETVSEGSPVTPAFATRGELIDHLVARGDSWDQQRGEGGWSREAAESFVKAKFAMSMVAVGGKLYEPRDGVV